jgi:hypothetical protein
VIILTPLDALLRILDRDRQRFQLHALLREELRNLAPLWELQAAHAVVLEKQFADWEPRQQDGLQRSYGNQALILKAWGRLEEALALHKKEEALCLELGTRRDLASATGNGVCSRANSVIARRNGKSQVLSSYSY